MSSRRRFVNPTGFSLNREFAGDGDKKEFVTEESSKETVKTIARGKPGDFRRNRGDYPVLTTFAQGLRVLRAPGFPCSLCLSRAAFMQTSGVDAPRDRRRVTCQNCL